MNLLYEHLVAIMPNARSLRASAFLAPLNSAMREFGIDTPGRVAAFLAQVAHESGELVYVRELASGAAYEGRKDLGNTQPGDGVKFKGRGLIQITGRANYVALSSALGCDFISEPSKLEDADFAARSAGWFWAKNKCNDFADKGDFLGLTKKINGGINGLADRQLHWERAKKVLGV